jgi:hypothetical protein
MERVKKTFTGILIVFIIATNNGTLLFEHPLTQRVKLYAVSELKYSITVSKDLIQRLFPFNNKSKKS